MLTSLSSYGALSLDEQTQVMAGIDAKAPEEDEELKELVAEFTAKVVGRRSLFRVPDASPPPNSV